MAESNSAGFSESEKQAMKQRAKELAAEKRMSKKREVGEKAVEKALDEMRGSDKEIGMKIHELVSEVAPELWPKTWYGFPAYSLKGKQVVCFYQSAEKGEARYATLGFTDQAKLDDGNLWPTSFAVEKITGAEEKLIRELLQKAIQALADGNEPN